MFMAFFASYPQNTSAENADTKFQNAENADDWL